MSPEVRRAALMAAAKTTFILSLGCSSTMSPRASQPASFTPAPTLLRTPEVPCAQHLGAMATTRSTQDLPASDPLRDKPGVYGAFTDITARTSERTLQCCRDVLSGAGTAGESRWACCSALPEGDPNWTMACTPWGPPCPPTLLA